MLILLTFHRIIIYFSNHIFRRHKFITFYFFIHIFHSKYLTHHLMNRQLIRQRLAHHPNISMSIFKNQLLPMSNPKHFTIMRSFYSRIDSIIG